MENLSSGTQPSRHRVLLDVSLVVQEVFTVAATMVGIASLPNILQAALQVVGTREAALDQLKAAFECDAAGCK